MKIYLRPVERHDIDVILKWENDHSITDPSSYAAPLTRELVERYVDDYVADPIVTGELRMMICVEDDHSPAGIIDLYELDRRNLHAHVAIYISEEYRRRGIAKTALDMMASYADETLGLHQLIARIAADADSSRALFAAAGYRTCGRVRSYLRRGRSYADIIICQKLF